MHAQPTAADNQDGPNGLQMLRTVGSGKYEFSDPGHPKGKQTVLTGAFCNRKILFCVSVWVFFAKDHLIPHALQGYIKADLFGPELERESEIEHCLLTNQALSGSLSLVTLPFCEALLE